MTDIISKYGITNKGLLTLQGSLKIVTLEEDIRKAVHNMYILCDMEVFGHQGVRPISTIPRPRIKHTGKETVSEVT